jgi:hypothetical protein
MKNTSNILKYFDYQKVGYFHVYGLKSEYKDDLLNVINPIFRQCYIEDDKLKTKAGKISKSISEFLEKYIIPDKGNIKSGDFGEMLNRIILIDHYDSKGIILFSPCKWLWKDSRNKATPFTDVVAFHISTTNNPTANDMLISVESKMKAMPSGENRIQDAINGAITDKNTRLAKTLEWLDEKYARDGDVNHQEIVQRFINPVEKGAYKKAFKAFAIIDEALKHSEMTKNIITQDDISIIIISIVDLKKLYEDNRTCMIKAMGI